MKFLDLGLVETNIKKDINEILEGIEFNKDNAESSIFEFFARLQFMYNKKYISDFIARYEVIEGTELKIKIRSKLKMKYVVNTEFKVRTDDENIKEIILEKSCSVLFEIFKNNLAERYVEGLNELILEITKGCDITFGLAIDKKVISDIYDDFVVFGISYEQALKIPDLMVFNSLYNDIIKRKIWSQTAICQTPAQIIKYENPILDELGVKRNNKLILILRSSFSRKSEYLGKNGVGYNIDGDFFSVIESRNGEKIEKMKPINVVNYLFRE